MEHKKGQEGQGRHLSSLLAVTLTCRDSANCQQRALESLQTAERSCWSWSERFVTWGGGSWALKAPVQGAKGRWEDTGRGGSNETPTQIMTTQREE